MSDGTKANTKFVTRISERSEPGKYFKSINGLLYYVSDYNLYKTDGTTEGTTLVAAGDANNPISFLTSLNGKVVYSTISETYPKSAHIHEIDASGKDSVIATFNNRIKIIEGAGEIYIIENPWSTSWSLWKSKGGKSTYRFFVNVSTRYKPTEGADHAIVINGILYLVFDYDLCKTNGTAGGTSIIKKDLYYIRNLTNVNGKLFFTASYMNYGREFWVSNGTEAGTNMLKNIMPGSDASVFNTKKIVSMNGYAYFNAIGVDGDELWRSDGTTANTVQIKYISPGANHSYIQNIVTHNNILYFTAYDAKNGYELWRSNGSTEGTYLFKDLNRNSGVTNFTGFKGKLYFNTLADPNRGLWQSDGTAEETNIIDNYNGEFGSGFQTHLRPTKDHLYYFMNGDPSGTELRSTDGTVAGTKTINRVGEYFSGREIREATTLNDSIFYIWSEGNNYFLSVSEAKTSQMKTLSVATVTPPPTSFIMSQLTVFKNEVYLMMLGIKAGQYHGLWKVNNSTNQIEKVKDISIKSMPKQMTVVGNKLYFIAENETTGRELWISNGTEAGTMLLKDISPGISSSNITNITNWNGVAYFTANDGTHEDELWTSDGTQAGTHLVKDINTSGSSFIDNLTIANNQLFFKARTSATGLELYKSDGTEVGTVLVKDINPSGSSNPEHLTDVNGILCFSALSSSGIELWRSDGTEEGTYSAGDIYPGPDYSSPSDLTNVDGTLYFVAYTPQYGRELYKYIPTSSSANRSGVIEKANTLEIYPNPANETITIHEKSGDAKIQQIEILNQQGLVLEKMANENSMNEFSISHLMQGLYLIKIYKSDDTFETIKIVKQ